MRAKLKGLASLQLTEHAGLQPSSGKDGARKWFTEKGNVEEVWDDRHLAEPSEYVHDQ